MTVVFVVAIANNGVIGRAGGLPWKLSTDMKRFKELTMGKPVVMGRKTWESFPKRPLPGRLNIVISRDPAFRAEDALTARTVEKALELAEDGRGTPDGEIAVIGGGEIYRQALPYADRLYVTHVMADIDGDTRFPAIEPADWRIVSSQDFPAGEKDSQATRYVVYERRQRL